MSTIGHRAKRFVKKGGVRYECKLVVKYHRRGDNKFWRCGCCGRGKLQSWDRTCAVCHAEIDPLIDTEVQK